MLPKPPTPGKTEKFPAYVPNQPPIRIKERYRFPIYFFLTLAK